MVPSTGMSTPRATTASEVLSSRGILAKYSSRIDAWKSMNTTTDRGTLATPQAVTPRRTTTRTVEGTGLSSRNLINSALASPCSCLRQLGHVSARTSRPLPDDLAENALGPEDQDENQDREGEDVLVLGPEGPPRQQGKVGGRERLEQTQHEPAEHGPRDVPDAPEHGRGEGLEPRDEARVRVDEAVLDAEEHARPAAHGPADQEGQGDHAIDVD